MFSIRYLGAITNDKDLVTKEYVDNLGAYYGDCDSGPISNVKSVTCNGFTLSTGALLFVKFNFANVMSSISLNVNNTGSVVVYQYGTTDIGDKMWYANEIVGFIYTGSAWLMIKGGMASTDIAGITKLSSSTTSNSESLAATPLAVSTVQTAVNTINGLIPSAATTSNQLADKAYVDTAVSGVSGASKYVATYNVTSFYSIQTAYNAGNIIVLNIPTYALYDIPLMYYDGTVFMFFEQNGFPSVTKFVCDSVEDEWTTSVVSLATESYVDTAIGTAIGGSY